MKLIKKTKKIKTIINLLVLSLVPLVSFLVVSSCNQKKEVPIFDVSATNPLNESLKKITIDDFETLDYSKITTKFTSYDFKLKNQIKFNLFDLSIGSINDNSESIDVKFKIKNISFVSDDYRTITFNNFISKDKQDFNSKIKNLDKDTIKEYIKVRDDIDYSNLNTISKKDFIFSKKIGINLEIIFVELIEANLIESSFKVAFKIIDQKTNLSTTINIDFKIKNTMVNSKPGKNVEIKKFKLKEITIVENSKPKNTIELNKIRYVSLGDSISAGFTNEFGSDSAGNYNQKTKVISGQSYSSFLANYIKRINPDKLESFENFSLVGSRTNEWLYLLGDEDTNKYNYKNSETYFDFALGLDKEESNPYKNRVLNQFKSFKEVDLNQLKSKIRDANLITINLGGNDLIFPMFDIIYGAINNLINPLNKANNEEKINVAFSEIISRADGITERLIRLNTLIRKLNPDAILNFISYPMALLRISPIVDKGAQNVISNLSERILNKLNDAIKNAVKNLKSENTNFINAYDYDDWKKNVNKFARIFYDIHPTVTGYKKMAQDIFLKLFVQENDPVKLKQLIGAWDRFYYDSDVNNFSKIKLFDKEDADLVKEILGNSQNDKLFSKNNLEDREDVFLGALIKNFINTNKVKIAEIVASIIDEANYHGYDTKNLIKSFLLKNDNYYEFAQILGNNYFIDKLFNSIQNDLDTLDLDHNNIPGVQKITIEIMLEIFQNQVLHKERIFELIKLFSKSNILNNPTNKSKIKEIVRVTFDSLIEKLDEDNNLLLRIIIPKTLLIETGLNNTNAFRKLITTIQKSKNIKNIVDALSNDFIDNLSSYGNTKNFDDLMSTFLKKDSMKNVLKTNIQELLQDLTKIDHLQFLFTDQIINFLELKNIPNVEIDSLKVSIANGVNAILNSNIYNDIFENIYQEIQNDGLTIGFTPKFFKNISSIFDLNDLNNLKKLVLIVGDDTGFSGEDLGNIINCILKYSNPDSSFVYNYLKDTKGKSTISITEGISVIEPASLAIKHLSRQLKKAFDKYQKKHKEVNIKDNPYYQASFRFSALIYIFVVKALGKTTAWHLAFSSIDNWLTNNNEYNFHNSFRGESYDKKWEGNNLPYYAWGFYDDSNKKWQNALLVSLVAGDLQRIDNYQE